MKTEVHGITFKDEEGKHKYLELVERANSENSKRAKNELTFLHAFLERLEAGDTFLDAEREAGKTLGTYWCDRNRVYDDILCPYWEHGTWLQKAREKSTKYEVLGDEIAGLLCSIIVFPPVLVLTGGLSLLESLVGKIFTSPRIGKISDGVFGFLLGGVMVVGIILAAPIEPPIYKIAELCQNRVNAKCVLPRS